MSVTKEQTEQHETPEGSGNLFRSGGAVSISEAARLSGKSRGTLYRHNKAGKLSFEKDDEDNPVVQIAELMRVYKSLKLPTTEDNDTVEQASTVLRTAQHSTDQAAPKEQVEQVDTAEKGKMAHVDTLRRLEAVQRQLANEKALRETEKASLDARIAEIKESYEARIDDLKDGLKSWQDQAQGSQRLLEHHETRQAEQAKQKKGFFARMFGG